MPFALGVVKREGAEVANHRRDAPCY